MRVLALDGNFLHAPLLRLAEPASALPLGALGPLRPHRPADRPTDPPSIHRANACSVWSCTVAMAGVVPSARVRKGDPPLPGLLASEAAAGGEAAPAAAGTDGADGGSSIHAPSAASSASLSVSAPGGEKLKRVGEWVFGETLGQGSFGKVKLAHHARTKEKVAVKIVDKAGIANVEDVERVYRETFILTTLKHPNIIKLFEVLDTPRSILLVMEYAGGGELFSYVAGKHRLSEVETCRLFQQIISGVEYCHRAKIIHRDLKLENILLDKAGQVKIADFGLSAIKFEFGQKMDTSCGTPSYTCPEAITGKKYVGAPADLWSLGVILFAMLSGFLPFESANIPALFRKIKQRQYKCPEYLSREAVDLIDRMLTLDPEKRASLAELRNHPWMLMEYTELAEQIEAQPPVTPEMIAEARAQCMAVGDEQNQAQQAANAQAQQAAQQRKFAHHSKSNSQPSNVLGNGSSAGRHAPSQSSDSLPSASASPSPTPDDESRDRSSSNDRDSSGGMAMAGTGSASSASSTSGGGGGGGGGAAGTVPRPREHRPSISMGGASAFSVGAGKAGAKGFRDLRNGAQPTDRYSPNSFAVGSTAANAAAAAAASKARTLSIFDKLSVRTNDGAGGKHVDTLSANVAAPAPLPLPPNSRYPRYSPNPGGDEGRVRFPPIGSPAEPLSGGGKIGAAAAASATAAAAARLSTSHGGRERARRQSEFVGVGGGVGGGAIPGYMQPTENAQNHLLATEREERERAESEGHAAARRHRSSVMASPPSGALSKRAGLGTSAPSDGDFYLHHSSGGGGGGGAYRDGVSSASHSPAMRGIGGPGSAKTPRFREAATANGATVPAYMLETNSSRQRGGSKHTDI